jgi:hypothetical protein
MGAIINFEPIYKELKDAVINMAVSSYKNYKNAVIPDITTYLDKEKGEIEKYTLQLSQNAITEDEFKFNVDGLRDLCEMKALEKCGVTQIELDKLKSNIKDTIITTILSKI